MFVRVLTNEASRSEMCFTNECVLSNFGVSSTVRAGMRSNKTLNSFFFSFLLRCFWACEKWRLVGYGLSHKISSLAE